MINEKAIINILEELDFASLDGEIIASPKSLDFSLLIQTQEGRLLYLGKCPL